MGAFFNRQILLNLTAVNENNTTIASTTVIHNKMEVSLSKTAGNKVINTGSINVTNMSRRVSQEVFANVKTPTRVIYSLKAGYGEATDELPLLSVGFVNYTNWNHQGGDTNVQFQVDEGVKYSLDSFRDLGLSSIPKGGTIMHYFNTLIQQGFEIEFRPDKKTVEKDLINAGVTDSAVVIKKEFEKILTDQLRKANYSWYIENKKLVVYKLGGINDFFTPVRNRIVNLNFKTGLMSADVENSINARVGIYVSFLKFKAFFIPSIYPFNFIEINEPTYPHLSGRYQIRDVSYSLTNKSGGKFMVTGTAVHNEAIAKSPRLQDYFGRTDPVSLIPR